MSETKYNIRCFYFQFAKSSTMRPRGQDEHAKEQSPYPPLAADYAAARKYSHHRHLRRVVWVCERLSFKLKGAATRAFPPEWLFTNDRSCLVIRELMHHHRIWIDGRADWPLSRERRKYTSWCERASLGEEILAFSLLLRCSCLFCNKCERVECRPLFFWFIFFELHALVPSHQ